LHVGYQSQKKTVTVTNGGTTTADFTMKQAIVQLDEVVTTATGQQRKVEIGNAIATLGDVSMKVEQGPVASIQDLIQSKAPGVSVLSGQ